MSRYKKGGEPLLYTKGDDVAKKVEAGDMGRCLGCQGPRSFELQIMPHSLTLLSTSDYALPSKEEEDTQGEKKPSLIHGMDWGTLLIYTCEQDCAGSGVSGGESAFFPEMILMQREADC